MPRILEMKVEGGDLWCRVGGTLDFPNGVALWTPDEQEANYNEGYRDGQQARQALESIREWKL